jgi:hypothetical protein
VSIYATLWQLKFPRHGDDHTGCDWITVMAQGVPAHVGASPGPYDQEADPYAAFLPPPAGEAAASSDGEAMRAVVFVTRGTPKGTSLSPQEYVRPLLVMSGQEYATTAFQQLHRMICDALRGNRARVIAECWEPDGHGRLLLEDGSVQEIERDGA